MTRETLESPMDCTVGSGAAIGSPLVCRPNLGACLPGGESGGGGIEEGDALLLESGDYLLLESGDKLLLE